MIQGKGTSKRWTKEEDAELRRVVNQPGTNKTVILQAFPHRTPLSVISRARKFGWAGPVPRWSTEDMDKLRALVAAPGASKATLYAAFPCRSQLAVLSRAQDLGWKKNSINSARRMAARARIPGAPCRVSEP